MKGSAGRSAGMITTALAGASVLADEPRWELAGVSVTPHLRAASMRFRRDPDEANGALVRLFIRGGEDAPARGDFRFNGARPPELVASGAWAWSDAVGEEAAADDPVPKGALTVVTFNTRAAEWDRGSRFELRAGRRGETVPGNDEAATAAGKGAGAPGNGGRLEACPTRIFEAAAHPAWRHPETMEMWRRSADLRRCQSHHRQLGDSPLFRLNGGGERGQSRNGTTAFGSPPARIFGAAVHAAPRHPETTKMTAATAAGKGAGAPGNGGRLEACPTRIFEAAAHPAWRHPETTKI